MKDCFVKWVLEKEPLIETGSRNTLHQNFYSILMANNNNNTTLTELRGNRTLAIWQGFYVFFLKDSWKEKPYQIKGGKQGN